MVMIICSWAFLQFLAATASREIFELELTADEKAALEKSAESVRSVIAIVNG